MTFCLREEEIAFPTNCRCRHDNGVHRRAEVSSSTAEIGYRPAREIEALPTSLLPHEMLLQLRDTLYHGRPAQNVARCNPRSFVEMLPQCAATSCGRDGEIRIPAKSVVTAGSTPRASQFALRVTCGGQTACRTANDALNECGVGESLLDYQKASERFVSIYSYAVHGVELACCKVTTGTVFHVA